MARIFKSANGAEVKIRPVNLLLAQDIEKSLPVPEPPYIEVVRMDGTTDKVPDKKNEEYKEALEKRDAELEGIFLEIVLTEGCDFELNEEQLKQVTAFRERMARRGVTLNPDDKYLYVVHFIAGDATETNRLQDAILNLNTATKEAINKARENFRR